MRGSRLALVWASVLSVEEIGRLVVSAREVFMMESVET